MLSLSNVPEGFKAVPSILLLLLSRNISAEEDTHPHLEAHLWMNVDEYSTSEAHSWKHVFEEEKKQCNMKLQNASLGIHQITK